MPVATQEDQFKFLISCIRYSNNGKVDFTEVAKECSIVSKGAAAKRYERMMKQHGLYQSAREPAPNSKPSKAKESKCSPHPRSSTSPPASKRQRTSYRKGKTKPAPKSTRNPKPQGPPTTTTQRRRAYAPQQQRHQKLYQKRPNRTRSIIPARQTRKSPPSNKRNNDQTRKPLPPNKPNNQNRTSPSPARFPTLSSPRRQHGLPTRAPRLSPARARRRQNRTRNIIS